MPLKLVCDVCLCNETDLYEAAKSVVHRADLLRCEGSNNILSCALSKSHEFNMLRKAFASFEKYYEAPGDA